MTIPVAAKERAVLLCSLWSLAMWQKIKKSEWTRVTSVAIEQRRKRDRGGKRERESVHEKRRSIILGCGHEEQ
ncbi:hypothetical protein V8C35DRAFT_318079 [Trichoderma chlorosporum]